jgi:hypothetical protein
MENNESDFIFLQTSSRVFTRVPKESYSLISSAILAVLELRSPLTIIELIEEMREIVKDFRGNLPWYVLRIKADLESKRMIRCQIGIGPERNQVIQKCRVKKIKALKRSRFQSLQN